VPGAHGYQAVLFNASGTILERVRTDNAGTCALGTHRILTAGIYYVKITRQGESLVRRIVVQ
jgi:hypothetical protein